MSFTLEQSIELIASLGLNTTQATMLLELTKGSDYRPYYVASIISSTADSELVRVDNFTFEPNKEREQVWLGIQSALDKDIDNIPPQWTIGGNDTPMTFITSNKSLRLLK